MFYQEGSGDSTGAKIGGAVLNALIIVGILIGVTFLFVCLFYYNCVKVRKNEKEKVEEKEEKYKTKKKNGNKVIYGWLFIATTLIFGVTGGITVLLVYLLSLALIYLFICLTLDQS